MAMDAAIDIGKLANANVFVLKCGCFRSPVWHRGRPTQASHGGTTIGLALSTLVKFGLVQFSLI